MRGALRTSRTRGGMRWTLVARETHAPDVYGEVVWFGRRGAGAKLAIRSAGDGGKRAVLREEHEVSRKATAQGRPGCSACTCMLVCTFAMCTGTRDRGCSKHPVFPAPSIQEEGNEFSNLGRNTPRDRESVLRCVARMERSAIRDHSNTAPVRCAHKGGGLRMRSPTPTSSPSLRPPSLPSPAARFPSPACRDRAGFRARRARPRPACAA